MASLNEPPWYHANAVMNRAGFTQDKMRLAQIWAAKYNCCPVCSSGPGQPCLNMADKRRASQDKEVIVRPTKWPHPSRVDWVKLGTALKDRGYE